MGEDPVISLLDMPSKSIRPAENITVTISASYNTPRDGFSRYSTQVEGDINSY